MLAKSSAEIENAVDNQSHPVIRTLYDHAEEVTCLEFHPSTSILISGSKDCNLKMFDYGKASVKKAYKVITVRIIGVFSLILQFFINDFNFVCCYFISGLRTNSLSIVPSFW